MTVQYPTSDLLPGLRELWKEAFGDTDAFLDAFFGTAFSEDRFRCIVRSGEVLSALYWFEVSCYGQKYAYLYAVATAQQHRGRGLLRCLLTDTHEVLRSKGYAGAILVPDGQALADMYTGFGYSFFGSLREYDCLPAAEPVCLRRISAEEYMQSRRQLLPAGAVLQEGESAAFLGELAEFYTGDGFLTAVFCEDGCAYGRELLGASEAAPAIVSALGCGKGSFRMPGDGRNFAMFCPLSAGAIAPEYFAFAFD